MMAFANFFDRTATAASQILSDFSVESYKATLSANMVGLYFDQAAAVSPEGRATLDICVRILARLYPAIVIAGTGSKAEAFGKELTTLAVAINDRIDLSNDIARSTVAIVVGETDLAGDMTKLFVGSDGWRARLSRHAPVGSGATANPFGAGAAGCFAAANIFRFVFASQLVCGDLDDRIDVSLFDYRHDGEPGPRLPDRIDLGDAYLAGLGAIGHGAMWALDRLSGIAGTLHAIDHDSVDLSNLQRYVMALQKDVGTPKSKLARRLLKREGLQITPHSLKWSDFVARRRNRTFERVAVALDSAADRISLQASLPRWIVNAWTQELDLGISRHGFDDGKACLGCLYLPSGIVKSEDERVAEELKMPEAKQEVRELLQKGEGVSENFVQRVATAFSVPFTELQPFVGQPLITFYQKAICGGMMIGLTGTRNTGTAVVPMAFQSALAGLGLAADLAKHAAGLPIPPSTSTRINLLRPLAPVLADPRARDASRRCICCDQDFIDAYRRKYAVGRTAARSSRRR
ncbi:E2 ligase fold family C protein [Bradyrhizobium japonicum]|uniref:E2 ligase fold family C protein n=1 Tax=Bradyrhizobium japonicum TaxID=375 RepID=UPI001E2915A9|nr:E2 ligase fold family C protein [Bradyrhizobium japonicum]MCD9824059.1 E2 ligase fold family C protein [Bradyrhizobium japonicum]MCD9896613.1 E2 ligase fold family C protein [Bradyrhizobium japonicum]MEB2671106.1 E2 ligase fold family C protein [Bradyrhizobium japonicum]WLB28653.1 E2 ligase fold family C protein [Bradyrhizobium japonicum]WRI90429.1 E2 ligase fold family C protein [Bradyrhizobium japonicum]